MSLLPQTQGRNGCLVTVFDPSCKPKEPPSCPSVFVNGTLSAASSDTWLPPGTSPEDLVKEGGGAYAASYILERGLVVPLRSTFVRGVVTVTEGASLALAALPVVHAEWEGLNTEFSEWRSGTCSTVWTK